MEAAHCHAPPFIAEVAYEAAYLALMDSLSCAFMALQDPACTSLLGSIVPGATMAFGARVPGTSYQLDPVQAAFNIGTMASWLQANDPALATSAGHLADNLGAILAVADYRARKAIAEGASPPAVRDVLTAMIRAHEHASLEWVRSVQQDRATSTLPCPAASASAAVRCALTRSASAASAVTLLGGTRHHVAAAVAIARSDLCVTELPGSPAGRGGHEPWRIGDATSRGVRLALIALAGQDVPWSPPPDSRDETAMLPAVLAEFDQTCRAVAATAEISNRIRERFGACVTTRFPPLQARKLAAMFADRARSEALPINELVSMTVRN